MKCASHHFSSSAEMARLRRHRYSREKIVISGMSLVTVLLGVGVSAAVDLGETPAPSGWKTSDKGGSALAAARALVAPTPELTKGGEFEGHKFWDEHDELLTRAWREHGPSKKHLYVYGTAFEQRYIHSALRAGAAEARAGRGEAAVRGLFEEVVPGVFASTQLFTEQFLVDMLAELEHIEGSGIPRRRPNGMNRYGVILDQVGLSVALQGLVDAYIRPLAAMLFPELVGPEDAEEHYAFTVRYEAVGDTELAKHGDASVATLNLCLGRPGWRGGDLEFFKYDGAGIYALPRPAGAGKVTFRPGLCVLHRGQHKHQALPLLSGERTNIIIWLFARHGVVRVAPYKESAQMTERQRWHQSRQSRPRDSSQVEEGIGIFSKDEEQVFDEL